MDEPLARSRADDTNVPREGGLGPASRPFSWSASRHDSFATCRRRYYYAYYAALEDPEIQRLKKLSALPLWAGSVVHDAIEAFLRQSDRLPSSEDQEALIRSVVHSGMLADWRTSECTAPGGPGGAAVERPPEGRQSVVPAPSGELFPFRLFEHEYAIPVEQEDKRIAVNTVMRSLKHFFRSDTLARALEVGRERWLALEDLVSFHVDGVCVFVRMDLAYRDHDGRVVIVDWKTGRNEGRFNEVQIAGYALYAAEQGWVEEPEQLATELSYLVIPKSVRRSVDRRKIDAARRFILKSASNMKALLLDPVQNLARLEDFPMIERPQVCRRCNFRRLCFPTPAGVRGALSPPLAESREFRPSATR